MPDTVHGKIIARTRELFLSGVDFVAETGKRCQERNLSFLLSWRMFDVHGLDHPEDSWTSEIYRRNPQFRIGDAGVSLFNFPYYRDYSLGSAKHPDCSEPPFAACHGIADPMRLATEPHHYVLAQQNWFHQGQLPLRLDGGGSRRWQAVLAVGQDDTLAERRAPYDDVAVLRLLERPTNGVELLVWLKGRMLEPCHVEGELFPSAYTIGVPQDHARYLDYELPLKLLEQGANHFTFNVLAGESVVLERLEVAVYRKGTGRGRKAVASVNATPVEDRRED